MASSQVVGHRGHPAADAGRGQGDGPVHRRDRHPRRLLHAGRRRRRLAPGRHADAPGGPGAGRADDRGRASRSPASTSRTAASAASGRTAATIEADVVVIACGIWSPRIARMAGASIPLHAGGPPDDRHRAGPALRPRDAARSSYPIVRDMDTNMYERQHGSGFEIGSYAHRAILMDADDIPSIAASALSPTMLPFTQEDFDPQLEDALELFPEIVGDESVGAEARDQRPALADAGRQPDHRRDARGQGPLVRRRDLDQGGARDRPLRRRVDDPRRARDRPARLRHRPVLRPPQDRPAHRRPDDRGLQQDLRHRPPDGAVGVEPADPALARSTTGSVELGAEFFEAAGWERPFWYGANEALLAEYGDRVMPRAAEWESRWWSPIINAEHLAMRDRAATRRPVRVRDLRRHRARRRSPRSSGCASTRSTCRSGGPSTRRSSTPPAGSSPTSRSCGSAHDRFRVVTGGGMGMRDKKLFADALPADGSAQLHDATNAVHDVRAVGPAGARHPGRGRRRPRRRRATPASRS